METLAVNTPQSAIELILDERTLAESHCDELARSGITIDQALAAGIRTVSDPKVIATIIRWEKPAKALGSSLVFTFRNLDGTIDTNYARLKPDQPRTAKKGSDKGKLIRYESPVGQPNRAYFPVGISAALSDPTQLIIVTEGEKKSLCATLLGLPTIGLVGVWGWQQKRERDSEGRGVGERKLIPDLDKVGWSGRPVAIVFDSDAAQKPEVQIAETSFAEVLLGRGGEVRVVRLPGQITEDGQPAKVGLDDYLLAHTVEDLQRLIDTTPAFSRKPPDPESTTPGRQLISGFSLTESGYVSHAGRTYHCVLDHGEDGAVSISKRTKLANFVAKIAGERIVDDGAETRREWAIQVEQFSRPPLTASIPAERFSGLDWITEKAGPRCVIQPGSGKRDHLRCAIQELSGEDIPSSTVFAHTGWREVGGKWVYLHGDGAIGPDGIVPSVAVSLHGASAHYRLPAPPTGSDLIAAIRASFSILSLAPDPIVFSIIAAIYRAALGSADITLWLSGLTGVGKSEVAALAQQHYGALMTRLRLPGNWASTDNAMEGLAFTIKDALLVADDFCPSGGKHDHDRMHRVADRLIRGAGNSAGRQRMNADGTLRPPRPPRALIVGTGEDVPRGHSLAARLWTVEIEKGVVDFSKLGQCQRDAANGLYTAALAGFVRWLAPDYRDLLNRLNLERTELRDRFVGNYPHSRTPDALANMLLGIRYALRFAEIVGAINESERGALWNRGCAAFQIVAGRQGDYQRAHDPVVRFAELLRSLLSSGRAHIAGNDGKVPDAPPAPEFWGWEGRDFRLGPNESATNWTGKGEKIGWVCDQELLLDPDSTFAAIQQLVQSQATVFPVGQDTLCRRLKERDKLLRTDKDRTTCKITVEGSRRRVLVLSVADTLSLPAEPGHSGQSPTTPGATGNFNAPDSDPDRENWDGEAGQNAKPAPYVRPSFESNGCNRGTDVLADCRIGKPESDPSAPGAPVAPASPSREGHRNGKPRQTALYDETSLDALRG